MKRVLVILLVIGLLVSGTVTAVVDREDSFQGIDVTEDLDDSPGNLAPCGGGGGGDGGSPD